MARRLSFQAGQVRQLHAQHRRLQRIEPEVAADLVVVVLRLGAMVAKAADPGRQPLVVGRDEPGIAKRTEILARKERKAAERAHRSGMSALVGGADRLSGILDDRQSRRERAASRSGSMSAHSPYRCTGITALVRGVIAARTEAASTIDVTGSTSTKTGVAPSRATDPAVAKNENVGVMTSSPGPIPSAISATTSASVPDDTPTAWATPSARASLGFQLLHFRTHNELLRVAHARDRREHVGADGGILRLEIEKRNLQATLPILLQPTLHPKRTWSTSTPLSSEPESSASRRRGRWRGEGTPSACSSESRAPAWARARTTARSFTPASTIRREA